MTVNTHTYLKESKEESHVDSPDYFYIDIYGESYAAEPAYSCKSCKTVIMRSVFDDDDEEKTLLDESSDVCTVKEVESDITTTAMNKPKEVPFLKDQMCCYCLSLNRLYHALNVAVSNSLVSSPKDNEVCNGNDECSLFSAFNLKCAKPYKGLPFQSDEDYSPMFFSIMKLAVDFLNISEAEVIYGLDIFLKALHMVTTYDRIVVSPHWASCCLFLSLVVAYKFLIDRQVRKKFFDGILDISVDNYMRVEILLLNMIKWKIFIPVEEFDDFLSFFKDNVVVEDMLHYLDGIFSISKR